MSDVKRPYRSPRREAQARQTRKRIVDAARRLWVARGFAATTIEAIAAEAGVAVQTVYGTFGSKASILIALLGRLEETAGGDTLMPELRRAGDAREQIAIIALFNRRLFEAGADILAIALGTVATDPDVAEWVAEGDRRRRHGQSFLVADWHRARALKPRMSQSEAGDILYTLTSPEMYLLLVRTSGWTPDRYERWIDRSLAAMLLRS